MTYVQLIDGVTVGAAQAALPEIGHPDYIASFVEVPAALETWLGLAWRVAADGLWAPAAGLAALASAMKARIAEERWKRETGGLTVAGVQVATDDRSKTLLTAADRTAELHPDKVFTVKTAAGGFVETPAATIRQLFAAICAQTEQLFAAEAAICAALDAAAADPATQPEGLAALYDQLMASGWAA